jgi:hypothetical protein
MSVLAAVGATTNDDGTITVNKATMSLSGGSVDVSVGAAAPYLDTSGLPCATCGGVAWCLSGFANSADGGIKDTQSLVGLDVTSLSVVFSKALTDIEPDLRMGDLACSAS